MNNIENNIEIDAEIDFRELIAVLWLNKKFILIFTILTTSLIALYSLSLNNIYSAQTLMAPTASSKSSNLLSQYSGLASMAGIQLPQNGGDNQIDIALKLVKSKKLLDRLMLYESFLPDLLASKSWNMQTNTISYDRALYDNENNQWLRSVSPPLKQVPSSQEALIEFSKLVSISQDQKTQLVTLNVDHLSPVVAQQWSIWIVKEINAILANMEISNSQASIDYLNNQIKITPYAELRTMFYKLIQESTQSMMLAEVNSEYILTTIDPPVISENKSQPQRLFICILAALFGGMLSILIIFTRRYGFKKEDELDVFKLYSYNWS